MLFRKRKGIEMNRMSQKQRVIGIILLAVWCFSLLTNISLADISPEELQKIENAMPAKATVTPKRPRRLLVFNLCKGYVHSSIPYGAKALEIMGNKTGAYKTVISSDMAVFSPENLRQFDAICFNNTTQLEFKEDPTLRKSLMDFVKGGKGIVGIHAATDCFYTWPEAAEMMGALFDGHPWCFNDKVWVEIVDPGHTLCRAFNGKGFDLTEEIYQFKAPYSKEKLRVLLSIDTGRTEMDKDGIKRRDNDFAISWVRNMGKGRVFYCSLGHNHHIFWNPKILQYYLDGIQFALGDLPADATPTAEKIWPEIAAYQYGQSRKSLTELDNLVRNAYGRLEPMKQIEKRLLEFLRSDATLASKQFVCRKLSIIGTAEAVPTLADMLANPKTSDMARYAMERIPGTAVDAALRKTLLKTTGKVRIGIINTLGLREDSRSVPILAALIYKPDMDTAVAAAAALGRIGGIEAAKALAEAKKRTTGKLQPLVLDAYLKSADKFVARGEQNRALEIYRKLYTPDEPTPVRIAALRGIVTAAPEKAADIVIDVLKGDDELIQTAAIGLVREIPGTKTIRAVAVQLPNLSVAGQVQMLAVLADRADPAVLPTVVTAAKVRDKSVRIAALSALGKMGDASCVILLAKTAAKTKGVEQDTARESLYRLRGLKINETILAHIQSAGPEIKVELICSTAQRNMYIAAETLLQTALDSDSRVRVESFKALKVVADRKYLPTLIDLLVNVRGEAERNEAEKCVAAVAYKIPDTNRRAEQVLAVLPSVKDVTVKCSLLSVLSKIGDDNALGVLRDALEDDSEEVRIAAVRALADWPNSEPVPDLLKVAANSDNKIHRALALRGCIRLKGLPSNRPPKETIQRYGVVMSLVSSVSEKKMALSGLANIKSSAALQMTADYLGDKALQAEAEAAVIKIAQVVYGSSPRQTKDILEKLLRISANDALRERANGIIGRIEQFKDYITAWKVSPVIYAEENTTAVDMFDMVFAPETSEAEDVIWQIIPIGTNRDRPWLIELDKTIGGHDKHCVTYLRTRVWSPKSQKVRLELGSNDGIKVWLNGRVVHANNVLRGITPGADKVKVTLQEGWNTLMMKITQGGGTWSACARFRTLDGGKLDGLKIQVED
jgi:type 1 glutamine amidotransferase